MCDKNQTHILLDILCDEYQCQDRSDESFCVCGEGRWQCPTADVCIDIDTVCSVGTCHCPDCTEKDPVFCGAWWQCDENQVDIGGMYFSQVNDVNKFAKPSDKDSWKWTTCFTHFIVFTDSCLSYFLICHDMSYIIGLDDDLHELGIKYSLLCENYTCPAGWWKCDDNRQCIEEMNICDGETWVRWGNCNDKSDENICEVYQCLEGYWKCANNNCIKNTSVCDGESWYLKDCGDQSEEDVSLCETWKCSKGFSKCLNYNCLADELFCDSRSDCSDGSDEFGCEDYLCLQGFQKCNNNRQCQPILDFCDDCEDNSDETGGNTSVEQERFCFSKNLTIY